jgi:hypothetical protein
VVPRYLDSIFSEEMDNFKVTKQAEAAEHPIFLTLSPCTLSFPRKLTCVSGPYPGRKTPGDTADRAVPKQCIQGPVLIKARLCTSALPE